MKLKSFTDKFNDTTNNDKNVIMSNEADNDDNASLLFHSYVTHDNKIIAKTAIANKL